MNTEVGKWMEEDGVKYLREIGVKKGQTLLDFGCGKGNYAIPASKVVGKEGRIYALDKDRDELEKLKKLMQKDKIKNIEVINKDTTISLENESVDIVLCYDVIHYQDKEKRTAVYNKIHMVLKEEGIFSVYPKHNKEDNPLRELARINVEGVVEEIEKSGFTLEYKLLKTLLHDEYYNEGYVLNFRKQKEV